MYEALFSFFRNVVFKIQTLSSSDILLTRITIFGNEMFFGNYLSYLLALICTLFIVVLCCLFVLKIIKLVGNLIK